MKIKEAIELVDRLKPNQYTNEDKIKWLTQLDSQIHTEILLQHITPVEPFEPYKDEEAELIVPLPYTDVYRFYLEMQIDLANAELEKYNNSMLLYNNAYSSYAKWYTRENMPVQKVNKMNVRC